jgi:hypothetical protein
MLRTAQSHAPKGRLMLGFDPSISAVRDRVVQAALKIVLEPVFEADFVPCSFGFRPGRAAHDARQASSMRLGGAAGGWSRRTFSSCTTASTDIHSRDRWVSSLTPSSRSPTNSASPAPLSTGTSARACNRSSEPYPTEIPTGLPGPRRVGWRRRVGGPRRVVCWERLPEERWR